MPPIARGLPWWSDPTALCLPYEAFDAWWTARRCRPTLKLIRLTLEAQAVATFREAGMRAGRRGSRQLVMKVHAGEVIWQRIPVAAREEAIGLMSRLMVHHERMERRTGRER